MDWASLATIGCTAASGAGAVAWYLFGRLQGQIDKQSDALADHKLHVAENYVTSNELSDAMKGLGKSMDQIYATLGRIEVKLDSKADKA
ncbi:hypothetical protein [Chromobacterium haemolyticum]|uniref:hypothetical protein n=1 Tax=Chromobacterium haemolyticum TaxID=394935 RepID=UPI0012FA201A|nr:hypothetical protein [Chromobacterium haemolyticum]